MRDVSNKNDSKQKDGRLFTEQLKEKLIKEILDVNKFEDTDEHELWSSKYIEISKVIDIIKSFNPR